MDRWAITNQVMSWDGSCPCLRCAPRSKRLVLDERLYKCLMTACLLLDEFGHHSEGVLTSVFAGHRGGADAPVGSITAMADPERSKRVMIYLSKFQQLRTDHIKSLVFSDHTSRISCDRTIKRLLSAGLIEQVQNRVIGGMMAGSGFNVYQLSSAGWSSLFEGRRPFKGQAVKLHALAVADVYIEFLCSGASIDTYRVEADAVVSLAGVELRPDMYIRWRVPGVTGSKTAFVEVDLSTEHYRQLVVKLDKYTHTFKAGAHYPTDAQSYPLVLFLCDTSERVSELRGIVSSHGVPSNLVRVELLHGFMESLQA